MMTSDVPLANVVVSCQNIYQILTSSCQLSGTDEYSCYGVENQGHSQTMSNLWLLHLISCVFFFISTVPASLSQTLLPIIFKNLYSNAMRIKLVKGCSVLIIPLTYARQMLYWKCSPSTHRSGSDDNYWLI